MTVTSDVNPLRKQWSQESRALLSRFDVDINDASNGTFLPNAKAKPADFDETVYGYQHRGDGIHSNIYMQNVHLELTTLGATLSDVTDVARAAGAAALRDKLQECASSAESVGGIHG